jgi:molybdate transport system substrate-binding protein
VRLFAIVPPAIAVVAFAAALAACGDGEQATLRVSAAASLKTAFEDYGSSFGAARTSFSFAGSDELAAQIRRGARPDGFAAANTKLPYDLYEEGRVERPVEFAANRLVVAVPADGGRVASIADLDAEGVRIAAGSAGVPVGSYTRGVLAHLGPAQARGIERNIRSHEPDVSGVVGKVAQGAVDAGFVYVTDVDASGARLRAIELPARLQPRVEYGIAVVKDGTHHDQAREFVAGLVSATGRRALAQAGFEPATR